jgi:hypothetical protein
VHSGSGEVELGPASVAVVGEVLGLPNVRNVRHLAPIRRDAVGPRRRRALRPAVVRSAGQSSRSGKLLKVPRSAVKVSSQRRELPVRGGLARRHGQAGDPAPSPRRNRLAREVVARAGDRVVRQRQVRPRSRPVLRAQGRRVLRTVRVISSAAPIALVRSQRVGPGRRIILALAVLP